MQGKGYIKFFLFLFIIVALWQYFLNVPIWNIEKKADQYAELNSAYVDDAQDRLETSTVYKTRFLDSVSNESVFKIPYLADYTYTDLKKRQLAFGLDLKGGMSSVLQVDLRDFLNNIAGRSSTDATFVAALDAATKALETEQTDFITLFGREFQKLSPNRSLAEVLASSDVLRDKVDRQSSNADVLQVVRSMADETVRLTFDRLKERIGGIGVAQPNITLDEGRDLILVDLPGVANPERAKEIISASAKLEFWDAVRINDNNGAIVQAFVDADKKLDLEQSGDTTTIEQILFDTIDIYDDLGNIRADTFGLEQRTDDAANQAGPLMSDFQVNWNNTGQLSFSPAVLGIAERNKMATVSEYLNRSDIKSKFPGVEFRWGNKPFVDGEGEKTKFYQLYGIRKNKSAGKAPLEGDAITEAQSTPDPQTGGTVVTLRMNQKGAKTWAKMTTKAANDRNREVAIVLDDKVISAPSVNGPITGGSTQITGNFSVQEAEDLANFLRIGKLPAKVNIIQDAIVGPSLGAANIKASITSMLVGFGLVLLFMILYYGSSGVVAIITLLANLFFIFGALASFGTVLTVPGIAGILLTIGMAVDANVIIFERIREELREGKSLKNSIADGFRHSYSAIIDANVTTILTAAVLAYFGLGPIKGFAVVLIIGVISSLFTAVLLGRMIIEWWVNKDNNMTFWTGFSKNLFTNLDIDWLAKRKMAYVFSGLLIAAGIVSMLTKGFELGVDFKGGYTYNIEMDGAEVSPDQVREALAIAFDGASTEVKTIGNNNYSVTTSYLINDSSKESDDKAMESLYDGFSTILPNKVTLKDFKSAKTLEGRGAHVISSAKVGPTIADDIKTSSGYATVFALLLIFLYIFVRFNKVQYSMGAVAALIHDTLIVLGLFSLLSGILPFSLEINQPFIAALLTVIGYSINDTVVVFDRIREFMGIHRTKSRKDVINMAVNSTVSRTVITSLTTLFVVLMMFIFGGASIKGFAFALLIGILVGTYSSIFVATPLVYDLGKDEVRTSSSKPKVSYDAKDKIGSM